MCGKAKLPSPSRRGVLDTSGRLNSTYSLGILICLSFLQKQESRPVPAKAGNHTKNFLDTRLRGYDKFPWHPFQIGIMFNLHTPRLFLLHLKASDFYHTGADTKI